MYEGGLKINAWEASPKTVQFSWGSDGHFATLKATGLVCEQDKLPNKTSKDFATMLFQCLANIIGTFDFKKGTQMFKVMIDGEAVLQIGDMSMSLSCTDDMSMFDQWVFAHLETMWKQR